MDEEEVNKLNDLNKDIIEQENEVQLDRDDVLLDVADPNTVMEEVTDSMERQRYRQESLDFKTIDAAPKCETKLDIERHAARVYTRTIFLLVQKEIIEECGSRPSVILFGDIPTVIPTSVVAPETSTIAPVISSAAPVMSSPEHISPLPATSPFLYTDSFEAPDSSDRPPSQDPYVMAVLIRRRVSVILSDSGRLFLLVDLQAHHLYGPRKLLTARKRVGPLPASRLACRRISPHSSDHRSSSSSSSLDSLPVHSSGLDALDQAHSGSLIRDVSPRLVLIRSEASIEEDTEVDPIETEIDIELGIGDGDDVKDHVEIDPMDVRDDTEEYEADTSAGDTVEVGIDPMSASIAEEEIIEPAGEDSSDSSGTRDGIVRSFEDMSIDLDDARVSMIERIDSLRLENLKVRAMLDIERDHVNSLRLHMSLSHEEFRQVHGDRDDTRGRLRRLESYVERHLGFRP
ncbi:hypothetical protein Tco_1071115 [Tanacetum coccineum]|uniref:Uncharacterized protein n=1 Tax=Tanacetum coccineum TaxID=301880 RepID=A0ABQ5HNK4_9ASTR